MKTRPRKPKGVSMSTVREVKRILRGGKKSKRRHAVGNQIARNYTEIPDSSTGPVTPQKAIPTDQKAT